MKSKINYFLILFLVFLNPLSVKSESAKYDLVIYGGTSAAITAAVQAKKMGKSVIVISPDQHLGGLSSGGLGNTDVGMKQVIGGLSREFYHRVWKHYQNEKSWRQEKRENFKKMAQRTVAMDNRHQAMWLFEPHVAEKVFEDFVREYELEVIRNAWLDRGEGGVTKNNGKITALRTLDGKVYQGRMFIDATYEGDLLAAAGVSYHVGREGKEVYGEEWNGVQTGVLHHHHHFDKIPDQKRISPYLIPGDPASGLLPYVSAEPPGDKYSGDHKVQAYCFRLCVTDDPSNRIPFTKPEEYDPKKYELLARIFDAGWASVFGRLDMVPNRKTDWNNHGPFSFDYIGGNYDYPEASYEQRKAIIKEHENYQKGFLYFIATDPRVPEDVQKKMNTLGYPKDEFVNYGGWPHQLYIREARRMIGQYVMTEQDVLGKRPVEKSVGMGSYTLDSHNVQRYITPEGYVQNEGDIGVKCKPYQISYRALVPKKEECENLFSPVCVSSSHIAFGSIRMEPVFMLLGQSAATAACLSIDQKTAVQDLDYQSLKKQLKKDGQVLSWKKKTKK